MALNLPRTSCSSSLLSSTRRPLLTSSLTSSSTPASTTNPQQTRHATLIPRPKRPYHFTQLVQLSDGSTYTLRTTSPAPLHRSTRDTRNHLMWQPSDKSLRNVEVDEAGKLAAFRARFGRGWDAANTGPEAVEVEKSAKGGKGEKGGVEAKKEEKPAEKKGFDALADLISGYASKVEQPKQGKADVIKKGKKQ